jgi:SAM-dependent methyltransferase
MLATRYPATTVYTMSSMKNSNPPTSYPAPLNHHSLYVPSISSATPFPDSYFDAIVSRNIATVLRNDEWARCFFDCMRVLKPGGQLEVLNVDAHLSCEGPKLSLWIDEHISCRLEAHSLSKEASDTVLDTMEIVGLENIRRARVALPAHSPKATPRPGPQPSHTYGVVIPAPYHQDSVDASRMMSFLGRQFYQDLHHNFLHLQQGEEWFWSRKDIRDECERYKTKMVLTIACAMKPRATPGESYLDI